MRRVLTGIRPTGPLHLGHLVGALHQWIPLQDDYDCFFLLADVQALTTHAEKPQLIEDSVREVVLDWLAVGLDPRNPNVHFVLQSGLSELYELTELLSMVTPQTWMDHNPTLKAEKSMLGKATSVGLAHYPVSQASDILCFSPDPNLDTSTILVPVGEDQAPHLEDTNRIAAAFNRIYGQTFVKCAPKYGKVGRLVGTDGKAKMSKSLGNCIYLGDEPKDVFKKVMGMYTDPTKAHVSSPGHLEENTVFMYLDVFDPDQEGLAVLKGQYVAGGIGDVSVKHRLYDALMLTLDPIRDHRKQAAQMDLYAIIREGTKAASEIASQTMARVRHNMHLDYLSLQ